jgi:hypothetical protein
MGAVSLRADQRFRNGAGIVHLFYRPAALQGEGDACVGDPVALPLLRCIARPSAMQRPHLLVLKEELGYPKTKSDKPL